MIRVLFKHYLYNRSVEMIFERLTENMRQCTKNDMILLLRSQKPLRGKLSYDTANHEAYIKAMFSRAREYAKGGIPDGYIYKKFGDIGRGA